MSEVNSSFKTPRDLTGAVGTELGVSEWITVDQNRINTFADCTEDHQWLHVDPDRADTGPFGSTIAHGYLTLSLLSKMLMDVVQVAEFDSMVNYGLNKVRFPSAVPAGSRVRGRVRLVDAQARDQGVLAVFGVAIEVDGAQKPACVAEAVLLYS